MFGTASNHSNANSTSSERTMILILISILFILCNLVMVWNWAWNLVLLSKGPVLSPYTAAVQFLFVQILFLTRQINHAANFWLYCVSGKRFRMELANLFCRGNKYSQTPSV